MRSRMIQVVCHVALGLPCWLCLAATARAESPWYMMAADAGPSTTATPAYPYAPGKATLLAQGTTNDPAGPTDATPEPASGDDALLGGCDDNICGALACCNMCPCTYGWVEGLILWRNNQAFDQPLVLNLNTDQTLLSTRDLDFNAAGGVRAGFGIRDGCGVAWEFNYLGLFNQSASAFIAVPDELALPGDLGLAVNNFFFTDQVSVRYTSQLNNAEINRVCCCCCCDCPTRCRSVEWLYGFRYLNLNEDFTIVATDFEESSSTYRIRTNNNLFGAQIGSRLRRCFGKWSGEATGKVGIFGNAAEQLGDPIVDFPDFLIRPARSTSGGQVAFLGDLNLTGIYQIDSVWGVRAGYNLIWVEGVALAPNQLDFTNTPSSGTDLSTNGGVFLHGVNIGLEARW